MLCAALWSDFSMATESPYYDQAAIAASVRDGQHREVIGGLWDEVGRHQFEFMVSRGLKPHHRLLDFGCGCLRGGVHFVRYLDPGNYYGTDINQSLLDAGYDSEIEPLGLADRLPRDHLLCAADGEGLATLGVKFDYALALSLFTHLPFNKIRTCLERLALVMRPNERLFATFFELPESRPFASPYSNGIITSYGDRDPYHYRASDLAHAAETTGWHAQYIGEFGHARRQHMMAFHFRQG